MSQVEVVGQPQNMLGIPNFGSVTPSVLYRGGQPTRSGFETLTGFAKTVISLCAESDDTHLMEGLNLRYIRIPIEDHHAFTTEEALGWLARTEDASLQPIFVHCGKGSGRTGLAVALYRWETGWDLPRIRSEAIQYRVPRWAAPWAIGWLDGLQKKFFKEWREVHKKG